MQCRDFLHGLMAAPMVWPLSGLMDAANLWLAGGGSGHGFKHGPALGELLAESLLGDRILEPQFTLERHREAPAA